MHDPLPQPHSEWLAMGLEKLVKKHWNVYK